MAYDHEAFLRISSAYTACTVDSLRVRCIPWLQSFHRLGAFACSPHPGVHSLPGCRLLCPIRLASLASSFRETFPPHSFPTALRIPRGVSRVPRRALQRDGVGGAFLVAPSALCGSPAPSQGRSGLPTTLSTPHSPACRSLLAPLRYVFRVVWLT